MSMIYRPGEGSHVACVVCRRVCEEIYALLLLADPTLLGAVPEEGYCRCYHALDLARRTLKRLLLEAWRPAAEEGA